MADTPSSRRVGVSGDVEVSAYLEIAREKRGEAPSTQPPLVPLQPEAVVVIDFGSQFSMLIARRVRECHVYCELVPYDAPWETIEKLKPRGIILSGGPASIYEPGAPTIPTWVFEKNLPVLGICYGMHALAHQLGGKVVPADEREYGHAVMNQETSNRRSSTGCRRRCRSGCRTATASRSFRRASSRSPTPTTRRSRR
jgi:GMP synthase (glutamine-hydrolysing)